MTFQVVSLFFSNCSYHIIEIRLHKYLHTNRIYTCTLYIWGYVHTIWGNFSLTWRHEKLFHIVWTPIWYVSSLFRDQRGAASLRHRTRAATTVLMCEQKPYRSGMVFVAVQKLSDIVWTSIRYVTSPSRDQRGAASLRHRNRASTTALVCQQKPYRSGMVFVAMQKLSGRVNKA